MLAARVEPKNGSQESKKTDNFKPLVLSQFQAAVDSSPRLRTEGPAQAGPFLDGRLRKRNASPLPIGSTTGFKSMTRLRVNGPAVSRWLRS